MHAQLISPDGESTELSYSPEAIHRLTDHELFCRWGFPLLEQKEMDVAPHHALICQVIDMVLTGEIKRLIINIPPGHGKTELTTVMASARIFAVNPLARIMHLSFSDSLVRKNSRRVRRLIKTPAYQQDYPNTMISRDSDSQGHWETTLGGEFHAVSTGGEVTGFRAGRDGDPFDGLIILDDMMKPKDSKSDTMRKNVNDLLNDTVTSRVAHDDTPIICIAQRLHENDTTDYLLSGGVGEDWHVLALPAIADGGTPQHYYDYSHGIVLEYDEEDIPPGALWQNRFGIDRLKNIQNASPMEDGETPTGVVAFAAQYMQNPMDPAISLFDKEWVTFYQNTPELLSNGFIRIDTANLGGAANDFTACTAWGSDRRFPEHLYGIDGIRIKKQPMQMFEAVADWIEELVKKQTRSLRFTVIRVEYANIGPALASYLEGELKKRKIAIRVELLKGRVMQFNSESKKNECLAANKFERAEYVLPWIQQGRLILPGGPTKYTDGKWVTQLMAEIGSFNLNDTHAFDDILDTAVLALIDKFHKVKGSHGYSGFGAL